MSGPRYDLTKVSTSSVVSRGKAPASSAPIVDYPRDLAIKLSGPGGMSKGEVAGVVAGGGVLGAAAAYYKNLSRSQMARLSFGELLEPMLGESLEMAGVTMLA